MQLIQTAFLFFLFLIVSFFSSCMKADRIDDAEKVYQSAMSFLLDEDMFYDKKDTILILPVQLSGEWIEDNIRRWGSNLNDDEEISHFLCDAEDFLKVSFQSQKWHDLILENRRFPKRFPRYKEGKVFLQFSCLYEIKRDNRIFLTCSLAHSRMSHTAYLLEFKHMKGAKRYDLVKSTIVGFG